MYFISLLSKTDLKLTVLYKVKKVILHFGFWMHKFNCREVFYLDTYIQTHYLQDSILNIWYQAMTSLSWKKH